MKLFIESHKRICHYFQRYPFTKVIAVCLLSGLLYVLLGYILLHPLVRVTVFLFIITAISLISHTRSHRLQTKLPILLLTGLFSLGLAFFSLMFMADGSSFIKYLFPLYLLGLGIALIVGDRLLTIGGKKEKQGYKRTF